MSPSQGRRTIRKSRFTEEQTISILSEQERGLATAEVCRNHGSSQATYFNWKKKYGGMLPTEMRQLKQLEDENERLKKIVADLSLDKEMLQDALKRKL